MKTIYKYPIDLKQRQWIQLPRGAEILSAHAQDNELFIWALVDTEQEIAPREVLVFATGEVCEIPTHRPYQHIDTVHAGPWVWHVFASV